jgi:23S rRNA pseudouridine2605 synthase
MPSPRSAAEAAWAPGGSSAYSPAAISPWGVPVALRPRLAAGLPFHLGSDGPCIGRCAVRINRPSVQAFRRTRALYDRFLGETAPRRPLRRTAPGDGGSHDGGRSAARGTGTGSGSGALLATGRPLPAPRPPTGGLPRAPAGSPDRPGPRPGGRPRGGGPAGRRGDARPRPPLGRRSRGGDGVGSIHAGPRPSRGGVHPHRRRDAPDRRARGPLTPGRRSCCPARGGRERRP